MNNNCIRIEGAILSPEILDKLDEARGQKPADFSITNNSVKEEISRAWADAMDYWIIYQRRIESLKEDSSGITETRNYWILPLLGLLGYKPAKSNAETVMGKSFAISHRDENRDGFPIHILGCRNQLDKKPKTGLRM
ncbi:MAG: hypothetical protein U9O87_10075 [Verrucomicrobiota bacterium]|nr:hypothetical protein [Verrucomicrobiota bacterium]